MKTFIKTMLAFLLLLSVNVQANQLPTSLSLKTVLVVYSGRPADDIEIVSYACVKTNNTFYVSCNGWVVYSRVTTEYFSGLWARLP